MRTKKELDLIKRKLAKKLEENILERYFGWAYFDQDIINEIFYNEEVKKQKELTKEERELILRPLQNLF